VVSNNESCDNNAKSSELIAEAYKVPGFYFDCPFYFGERAFHFLAGELEDLFKFLGEVKGQPLDQEKLVEVLESSRQVVELSKEINRLRQAVPYPANSRLGLQSHLVRWYFQGRPEAVEFMELVRDELRRRVDAGQGPPDQRFRFISLFLTPNHQWKLLDWMEREHGAYIIQDPDRHHWGPIDWDFSRPMYTLSNRLLAEPVAYLTYSPIQKWVDAIVEETRDSKADGVIFWAHTACRQACATIRVVKDALTERDIPSLVLDVDTNDPSFVSEDELKDRLEGFMERIEENR
jgi:benzoyl-CoA reductase/2-hydroxyglutaryl-CoA dehydratase subunit BcrC/BadD/HgdB